MARQKGLLKLTGTIGGINFYVVNGVGFARNAGGGFNGDAIRHQPNMQRVRENASEFGHCSKVKKAFRLALMPFLLGYKHSKLHARMMTLFTSIKALDTTSERGSRRVGEGLQTAKGRQLLHTFEFTPQHKMLNAVLCHSNFNWPLQVLSITEFSAKLYPYPKAATHVSLTLGILDFNFDTLESSLKVAPTYFLEVSSAASSFEIAMDTVMATDFVGIAVLGLRFYEVIDDEVYGLNAMVGVRLLDVRV
ncbi:hypothetical protein HNV10_12660 [Winogradskyella litoriviva]|uniref:Uncharacterized protein n=1 Tax=Winogradskyella litoriviva TaxID=1220182 RepID=A0ABX2E6G9_9FLAO|nr:hypothetical protein [Winogradskyella litoriviva]NRD24104.1 hypothetical protein [Winogradskyella litoriviva]